MAVSSNARLFDPLWFLTRQWQMGEFQAEDTARRFRRVFVRLTRCYLDPYWASYPRIGPVTATIRGVSRSKDMGHTMRAKRVLHMSTSTQIVRDWCPFPECSLKTWRQDDARRRWADPEPFLGLVLRDQQRLDQVYDAVGSALPLAAAGPITDVLVACPAAGRHTPPPRSSTRGAAPGLRAGVGCGHAPAGTVNAQPRWSVSFARAVMARHGCRPCRVCSDVGAPRAAHNSRGTARADEPVGRLGSVGVRPVPISRQATITMVSSARTTTAAAAAWRAYVAQFARADELACPSSDPDSSARLDRYPSRRSSV